MMVIRQVIWIYSTPSVFWKIKYIQNMWQISIHDRITQSPQSSFWGSNVASSNTARLPICAYKSTSYKNMGCKGAIENFLPCLPDWTADSRAGPQNSIEHLFEECHRHHLSGILIKSLDCQMFFTEEICCSFLLSYFVVKSLQIILCKVAVNLQSQ